jgi:hypothetical protein
MLQLNELEYLEMQGLNVMLAHDYYPEGHQGGVGIIQNGLRVATNGDLRLEPTPGQWGAVPKVGEREIDRATGTVSVHLEYPDESKNRRGFNPIEYPDVQFAYRVSVVPADAPGESAPGSFVIRARLESPLPSEWIGKVGLNLEFFPGFLFGKSFVMDERWGTFPRQANGSDAVLAAGNLLSIAPEVERQRLTIQRVRGGELHLLDGRAEHNNGWFVVRALLEEDGVVEWLITPNVIENWKSAPVIQVSQVGYHPAQPKFAVLELDARDEARDSFILRRILPNGERQEVCADVQEWGRFLRSHYLRLDFSDVQEEGLYEVAYGDSTSEPFRIGREIFDRHVWQPTVEYFLPVQMCHMRVEENYRVWHGACHLDDARMAPINHNHFDGYIQGPSTLCSFAPGDCVPGLDVGGWHDAGDYDLRVESQADTVYGLALAYELFQLDYDNTTIDQERKLVQMLRPDGKPDVLQQVEHGCLSIVGGYRVLGRLYRGIIEPTLKQYVHLGDAATHTDNVASEDDRWVFTEENPARELSVGAALVAASRVVGRISGPLAEECQQVGRELWHGTAGEPAQRVALALELLQATGEEEFRQFLLESVDPICEKIERVGWTAARSLQFVPDQQYQNKVRAALGVVKNQADELAAETPYGLPYKPDIWGAGWAIQRMGVQHYWLHRCCPEIFSSEYVFNALSFVLGCHPGPNTASFVSGVGAKSLIPGYGVNRADWSYIPGGIGSGTALIRPDYPELLEFPYLWQQTEYCVGYPTSDFVFLVAAVNDLCSGRISS